MMTEVTNEAKALVEALKRYRLTYNQRWKLVDLIETQAREIERLRGDLEVARKEAGSNYRVALAWERTARAALGESHDQ